MVTPVTGSSDFDRFATSYQANLQDALGRWGGESSYYMNEKVRVLSREIGPLKPRRILDFGSGVGEAVPFLVSEFDPQLLVCVDESIDSLRILKTRHPSVVTSKPDGVEYNEFDLVFVANVLHHVEKHERQQLVQDLTRRLRAGGILAIFEHNPLNPVTRRIVSNCLFDEGVRLLRPKEVKHYLQNEGSFSKIQKGYCLFAPEPLKQLRKVDRLLRKFPLGGQFYVIAQLAATSRQG